MWTWLILLVLSSCFVVLYSAVLLERHYDQGLYWAAFFLISAVWFYPFSKAAGDFSQFYIAAKMPVSSLYNFPEYLRFGKTLLASTGARDYPGFLRPAAFAPVMRPLGWMTYWHAFLVWEAVSFLSYAVAIYFLIRRFDLPKALLPAFALFFPALFSITIGQDIDIYFLVLLAGLLCLLGRKDRVAGVLIALCTYKFYLILLVVFVLVAHRRWKAVATFGGVAASLAAVSMLLVPPREYINEVLAVQRLTGLFPSGVRGVLLEMNSGSWYVPIALLGLAVCIYLVCRLPIQQALGVAITGVLLFGYYGMWYDCTLLLIPIAIAWRDAGPFARKLLLALLLLPPAWPAGERSFQVLAECFLLLQFALWAWKHSNGLPATPVSAPAGRTATVTN